MVLKLCQTKFFHISVEEKRSKQLVSTKKFQLLKIFIWREENVFLQGENKNLKLSFIFYPKRKYFR